MKAILSEEDFINLLTAMEKFREKEGPELQKYMLQRYATKRNWLSEIWLNVAYLSSREPTAVNVNCFAVDRKVQPTTNQLARASNLIHAVLRNHQMIQQESMTPQYLQDLIPLTMEGYRNLNCTCRIPGIEVDTLKIWKDSKHVIVYRKGVYFKFDGFALDVDGRETALTVAEVYNTLQQIVNISDDAKDFSPVAVFTAQKRDVWAKVHNRMLENSVNRQSLEDVESSLAFFVLEDESPKTNEEESIFNMCGNGPNRWFDKSMQYIIYANGKIGVNAEHAAADATLPGRVWEFILGTEKYTENGDIEKISKAQQRKLPVLQKLEWDLSGFEVDLETAFAEFKKLASTFDLRIVSADYGKGWIKKKRMSPDGYIQMALQLAYYRLYMKIPKTYESASTRIFAQGRTETIRPVSELSVQWVKSMLSDRTTKEQKILLLKKAIQYQTRFKTEAGCGQGWDRHMLGMYIISKQINMPTPELFRQQALWRPDDLSTSQTPTRYSNLWTLENSAMGGGFAPVNPQGYGVSYNLVGEDVILFYVSSNAHCTETSTTKMADSILDALAEMKELLS
ncbi:hypothetical protein CHS0354_034580 [Potamilus streckersoni]|uniref:Choline/carnitine acyltransferase domain-containing protein n=1 Tax=Potamilus streckersoni TaxID=2493646 RepID=A0AAE0STK3_9BIVA|nr:hypothetical protein CHS0354_034580 [Potamilus streckersoni]